ncbi:hypothetical protein [Avrilella dinanensis]|uniref:hypothetical protein n=1 Tax=Avrilella dinanensis TaxID=2008672 RepID=UPI00240A5F10|nr:hypothetical protein [Avrilella dinanensis]
MKPLFTEKQRFNQWWVWLLIILTLGVPFIVFFQLIISGEAISDNLAIIFSLIIPIACIYLIYITQLKTEITRESISFQFVPFVKRSYFLSEIQSVKVINYGFVGGWGIRFTTKYGTVYNIKGNKGLYVHLKDGKTFIIGTQKPEELEKVIEQLKRN